LIVDPKRRPLLAIPALLGLVWLAASAASWASADAIVFDSSREMGTWSASHAEPGLQTWQWVHDDLARAAVRTPTNPMARELLGMLASQRTDRQEYIEASLGHFVAAIELRPTSPYTWANVAAAKYRLGDTGREFEAALTRSAELGPSEPEVRRIVADLGLAVWQEVAAPTREVIDAILAAGVRRNPAEMLQIAERRGRLAVVCGHVARAPRTTNSKWSQLCQSTEATS
jgi:hypothetical protein